MKTIDSEILIVGGGGAGMSAAAAASSRGASVAIVDDNPHYGGQIWRRGIESKAPPEALELIDRLEKNKVRFVAGACVYDGSRDGILIASQEAGTLELRFRKLILALGARERFLPFPGWTLPNIYGAGGLQALVKGGLDVKAKKIIIAGTGPLLLAVSDYLQSRGAKVLLVAEQAAYPALAKLAAILPLYPSKLRQAFTLRFNSGAAKFQTGSYVVSAFGKGILEGVRIKKGKRITEYECDILATGFHLVPNLELPLLLGCKTGEHGIEVDKYQETSIENIYAAGETTGIGGIELSCIEGVIAGRAATGDRRAAEKIFRNRRRYSRFAVHLNRAFKIRTEIRNVVDEETIVCRCEDIVYGDLGKYDCWRDAKLQTRCGMGPCQGRICGPAVEYLFGWKQNGVRPPIFPVNLGELGNYEF